MVQRTDTQVIADIILFIAVITTFAVFNYYIFKIKAPYGWGFLTVTGRLVVLVIELVLGVMILLTAYRNFVKEEDEDKQWGTAFHQRRY